MPGVGDEFHVPEVARLEKGPENENAHNCATGLMWHVMWLVRPLYKHPRAYLRGLIVPHVRSSSLIITRQVAFFSPALLDYTTLRNGLGVETIS
jgi:hypothetical protein